MSEEKKIFCFNAKLNSDKYFNPKSDAFKKSYILIDNEKLSLKDLWEEHKQLKRLQAENEDLKHKNEILLGQLVINDGEDVTVQISQSQFNEYNELKAENEQLKKQIEKQKNAKVQLKNLDSRFADDYCKVKAENERLKKEIPKLSDPRYQIMKVNEGYYNRMKAYKQALEEIREIAKIAFLVCDDECGNADKFAEIQRKISEVLKDER